MTKRIDRTTLIADASWCPDTRAGGWAVWVTVNKDGEVFRHNAKGRFKECPASALEAEVWALENGIYVARTKGAGPILAQSDCTGALGQLRRRYSDITFRHVKGHTKNQDSRSWVNRWCDRHARRQMKAHRQLLQQS